MTAVLAWLALAPSFAADALPQQALDGAEQLGLDPRFVHRVQQGLEMLYLRRYEGARDHFAALETEWPGTAMRNVADVLVWQALMMENFDFRYDKQYWTASKAARGDLEAARAVAGNEAWEALLYATVFGIESIHTMRQGGYVSALKLAFQAMDEIEACRAAAPKFVDLTLADGLYNYWRSAVTMHNKMLPDFGDHRAQGLAQMQSVEANGVFVRPMATLSLAFSFWESGELSKAATYTAKNRAAYPDNVINNLVSGMLFTSMRRYDDAIVQCDRVLEVDPKNTRVHYWKGLALLKSNRVPEATSELQTYLTAPDLEVEQRSYGHYRLGQAYEREKSWAAAMEQYRQAVKLDGHKSSKAAIEHLEEKKKAGTIAF